MMRANPNFELINIDDEYMLVPVGEQMDRFNGAVVLNEVSSFIFERLKKEMTEEDIVKSLINEYEIDSITAKSDVQEVISKLKMLGIIYE